MSSFRTLALLAAVGVLVVALVVPGCVGHTPDLAHASRSVDVESEDTVPWTQPLPWAHAASGADDDALRYERRLRAWMVEQFRSDAGRLAALDAPVTPEAVVVIHDGPMTPPSIIEGLDAAAAARRDELEKQVVESTVTVWVPGIRARDIIRFEALSCFETWEGNPSGIAKIALHGPVHSTPMPEEMVAVLGDSLPANQGLRSEVTHPTTFKNSTRYTNAVVLDLDIEVPAYRYALFADQLPENGQSVTLSAGVFLAVDRDGGTLLLHRSYYQGQAIPGILEGFVRSSVKSSYVEFASQYELRAPQWLAEHPE